MLKQLDNKKKKEKIKEVYIEGDIPEAPNLSDFEIINQTAYTYQRKTIKNELATKEKEKNLPKLFEEQKSTKNMQDLKLNSDPETTITFNDEENFINNEKTLDTININKSVIYHNKTNLKEDDEFKEKIFENITRNVSNSDNFAENITYTTLSNAIKTLSSSLESASAPEEENYCIRNETFKTEKSFKHKWDLRKYQFNKVLEDTSVTPYTDEELSKFYHNPELQDFKIHIEKGINNDISDPKEDNYFYKLLVEYVQSKSQLQRTAEKIKKLKIELDSHICALWTVWEDVKIENSVCRDGNTISFTQKFMQAQFNSNVLNELVNLLKELKCMTYENFLQESFVSSFLRLKIENYLQNLGSSCKQFTNLDSHSLKISCSRDSYYQECLQHLKQIIGILFIFQRKENIEVDNCFLKESRNWLSNLVSILLRVGTWKDQIFLFNHVLQCPGGISEWAMPFIQLPSSLTLADPFNNEQINHIMTILHIFFSPRDKNDTLGQKLETLIIDPNPWIFVDSDGEVEDEASNNFFFLKENDLMSILNQIPFGYLFKEIFRYRENEITTQKSFTFNYLLKLFSFSTDLIKILFNGLKLYNANRYKQFNKRLGQLICHVVQYTTDVFTKYMSGNIAKEEVIRIQAEYDNFFFKSTKALYLAKKHGLWQFLATISYRKVSSNTILKIYALLQLNDIQDETLLSVSFINFEEKFLQLPEEEQYYLLNTFTNMALARDISEIEFIRNILFQLFYIGFVGAQTIDFFNKNVKYLLCSICICHPFLISDILDAQNQLFASNPTYDERLSIYLWLKLPLEFWKPTEGDLEIISNWLLEPLNGLRNELSRIILQSLNYGICEGELFLSSKIHRAIAFMLMQASCKTFRENGQGLIKNVSSLVYSQNNLELSVTDWAWSILLKLRLHLLDKPQACFHRYINNLPEYLKNIPELDSNIELHNLVLKNYPIACFLALMTTTHGHSVPLMIDKGFDLVEVLLNDGKYNPAIACIEFMTFLFLECGTSLHECEKFISVLSHLIAAENTYVQRAKNLISTNSTNSVLKSLECMIQTQLNCCRILSVNQFNNCIILWMMSLSKIPSWTQEIGVLHLMDNLIQNAFFNYSSTRLVTTILESLWEENKVSSETKSSFYSLLNWINVKFALPSWLPKGFNGDIPWLSYLITQIEFDTFEQKNNIWVELLKELYESRDKKTDIDNSLKKVCNLLGYSARTSSSLAIYKWTDQILNTDIMHPLVPLMWQKFFFLFFYRTFGKTDCGSLGRNFFDGVFNQRLFKQLNDRLTESINRLRDLSDRAEESEESTYYQKCYGLFQTYSLWLNDPKLHDSHLNINFLSPEYNPELLGLLIHGSDTPWIEFTPYKQMEQSIQKQSENWLELKDRLKNREINRSTNFKVENPEKDKLSERLKYYETPLPPPEMPNFDQEIYRSIAPNDLMDDSKIKDFLKSLTKSLMVYKDQYIFLINQNLSLSFDLQELSKKLYEKRKTQKILKKECLGTNKLIRGEIIETLCSGPAVINFKFDEWIENEQIQKQFDQCRKAFDENIQKNLSQIPPSLIISAVSIDTALEELKQSYLLTLKRSGVNDSAEKLKKIGVGLFYDFVLNEKMAKVPPLERAFDGFINILGKTFLENNECENEALLHHILNNEIIEDRLLKYFSPNAVIIPYDFVRYYSITLECKSPEKLLTILSKFDLIRFVHENEPKFSVRSALISLIGRGLISCNEDRIKNHDIIKVLNTHLEILLKYDFPEHYGEVLNFLLEASRDQTIDSNTWYSFLNALVFDSNFVLKNKLPMKKLKQYFVKCASDQGIPLDVIKGTIKLLASNFNKERSLMGIQGLYGKYYLYTEPLLIFFGMLSFSCVAKTLELDSGSLAKKLIQHLWPILSDLYVPWLVPYRNIRDNIALVGGNKVDGELEYTIWLPWSLSDVPSATLCISIFTESIRFVLDTLPGFNNVLSYLWCFYVTHFAQAHVKEYIWNVVHEHLITLPWEAFYPSLQDMESMVQVVNHYLPFSHSFLGNIFIKIKWTELLRNYKDSCNEDITAKFHICLLHLLVKLPMEPTLKQNEKILVLLNEAEDYDWHLVDANSYEAILNWFVTSCDPRIILMDKKLDYFQLDSAIFRLLKTCSGLTRPVKQHNSTTLIKRSLFIKASINWLISSNKKFKYKESSLIKEALIRTWEDVNFIVNEDVFPPLRLDEITPLISEFFTIFAESGLSTLMEDVICDWLLKPQSKAMVLGLLYSTACTVDTPNQYGRVIEASLENYFNFIEDSNWSEIVQIIQFYVKTKTHLDKILIENKYFLTLYASLLRTVHTKESRRNVKLILTDLFHILTEEKLGLSVEPKLLLLMIFSLKLIDAEINLSKKDGILFLSRLFNVLNEFVDDKRISFLSAVGLKKPSFSNKYKLICCSICGGIVVFLKKNYPESYADIDDAKVMQVLNSENKVFQEIMQYFTYVKAAVENVKTIDDIIEIVKDVGLKLFSSFYLK